MQSARPPPTVASAVTRGSAPPTTSAMERAARPGAIHAHASPRPTARSAPITAPKNPRIKSGPCSVTDPSPEPMPVRARPEARPATRARPAAAPIARRTSRVPLVNGAPDLPSDRPREPGLVARHREVAVEHHRQSTYEEAPQLGGDHLRARDRCQPLFHKPF